MKQDGKLNFVVVIASGDRLKEVMLEAPGSVEKGQVATKVQPSHTTKSHEKLDLANGHFAPQAADQKRPLGREQRSRRF